MQNTLTRFEATTDSAIQPERQRLDHIRTISNMARGLLSMALALALTLGTLSILPAQAATLTVTNANDSGPGSLRQAIADASAGDTITFDGDYTITLAGTLIIDKYLSVDGGTHTITISGNDAVRVLHVIADTQAIFNHLSISHGRTVTPDPDFGSNPVGGGIKIETGAMVTIYNSVVDSNTATYYDDGWGEYYGLGGGIFNLGTLTVIGTTFSDNVAAARTGYVMGGGGAICNRGALSVSDSTFTGNAAESGGALYSSSGTTMTVENCTLTGNSAPCGGGAISNRGTATVTGCTISANWTPGDWCEAGAAGISNDYGTLTVSNSTISGNDGGRYPGGLSNYEGELTVVDCTVYNNTTTGAGGGLWNWWNATLTVRNCTIYSNSAGQGGGIYSGVLSGYGATAQLISINNTISGNTADDGGGIYNAEGLLTLTNNTVTNNTANVNGGGLYSRNATPAVTNSLFWGNAAIAGSQIYNSGTGPAISYSDVQGCGGSGAGWDAALGTDGGGNIDQDPQLGVLADNGGSTQTQALQEGSPAINTADAAACPATDQRGVPRPLGTGCDIGAFEYGFGETLFHTVTYDPNGATRGTAPADQTKIYNVDLALATNSGSLARSGFAFSGWNTAADGLGTDYAEGASYTADAAITLYARWTDERDFGDAPDPAYPTLLANDGARHLIVPPLFLGAGVDNESDGQPDAGALGDDNDGNDDEDGVVFGAPLACGTQVPVTITASVPPTGPAFVDAWIDFNADGDWADAGEQIFASVPVANGTNKISFGVPAGAIPGNTFARFRISSAGGLACTGLSPNGEVEDYQVRIDAGAGGNLVDWNGNLVADFGANGLWYHDGSAWHWLTNKGYVGQMAVWNGNLVVDFGPGSGLQYYDGTWHWMTNNGGVAGMLNWNDGSSERLVVDFGAGRRVYTYNGTWNWLTNKDDVADMTVWNNKLVVDFGSGRGVYNNDGTWHWMTNKDDVTMMQAWNDGSTERLVVDFGGGRQIYTYNGAWSWLTNKDDANDMTVWNNKLVVDFGGGRSLYNYDTTWHWMSNKDDTAHMVNWADGVGNERLAVDFGSGRNMHYYDGAWHWMKNANNVPEMVAWNNGLAVDFGSGVGVYLYNNGAWSQIRNWSTAD